MNEKDISYIANNIKDKNSVEYKYFNKIVKQKKFNL
jgi:zona occludens toxin (predicted ATPase)